MHGLTGLAGQDLLTLRGGVRVRGDWALALRLNLMSRLAQRVLVELAHGPTKARTSCTRWTASVAWRNWFAPRQAFGWT